MRLLLKPVELAWRGTNRVRRALFRAGVLRSRTLPRPVISVGNISVGGSGKTPVTVAIARELLERGKRVAILSRGYGRESTNAMMIVDSANPSAFGDEPVLLWQSARGADVVVGADRWSAAKSYLRDHDCDVFLMDDGFQHLRLARDLDIVIDQPDARWLRDSPRALEHADAILRRLEGGEPRSERDYRLSIAPSALRFGESVAEPDSLRGKRVFSFAGLARNEQFFDMLRNLGADLVAARGFADHHRYDRSEVLQMRRDAASEGAEAIITTAKDFVKIGEPGLGVLEVEARIDPRDRFFDQVFSVFRS